MSKGFQIAAGATLIALLLGWLGWGAIQEESTFTFYQSLEEFLDSAKAGERVRVHGYVSEGSIQREVAEHRVRFIIQSTPPHAGGDSGSRFPVVFNSLETPDLFKGGAEVVVEGHRVNGPGQERFSADKLLAKCPSKFEGSQNDPVRSAALD